MLNLSFSSENTKFPEYHVFYFWIENSVGKTESQYNLSLEIVQILQGA